MRDVFSKGYADLYDVTYAEKPYDAECDVLERVFREHGTRPIGEVLDLGCGTGSHAMHLSRRGYRLVGVDVSAAMLARAKEKLLAGKPASPVELVEGDVRTVELGRTFDAALMMFAVLGYQTSNRDVAAALENARRHLAPGSLLALDVWYGPAVLAQRPATRFRTRPVPGGQLLRLSEGDLDVRHHLCTVRFHLWRIEGGAMVAETVETHRMRFFFPLELELFLAGAGFELVRLSAFPEIDSEPDETTWNVLAVARAR